MPTRPLYFLPITDDPKKRDKGIMDGWSEARQAMAMAAVTAVAAARRPPARSFVRCVHEDEPGSCHDHL